MDSSSGLRARIESALTRLDNALSHGKRWPMVILVVAFAFNLNRVAVLLGVYSNLPWILPAYYTLATMLGAAVLRVDLPPRLLKDFQEALTAASWGEFRSFVKTLTPLVWAYALGSLVGAAAIAIVAYRASLTMIVAHRRRLNSTHQQQDTQQ